MRRIKKLIGNEKGEKIEALVNAVYGGARWNPGNGKRVAVQRRRGLVLDINVCSEPNCNCGWNIQIGSCDHKLLEEILDLVDRQ